MTPCLELDAAELDNVGLDLSLFDYRLPEELIAQAPLADRAGSRMLVLYRNEQRWEDRMFREFPSFLQAGDCLVLNDSKVFPSRLLGKRGTTDVEVFLLRPVTPAGETWEALVRPGKKLALGEQIVFGGVRAEIVGRRPFGERTVRFALDRDIYRWLNEVGHVPLPPYIKRADGQEDRQRYQTVFAQRTGSVAAPTAGLHFTQEILTQCREQSRADIAYITLHVGLGTFQPVRGESLHVERFSISEESEAKIRAASRVVCAGTTSVRSVESLFLGRKGETDLFIRPGFAFQRVDAMLTNFHLPQSSLLMLVCAFAGREFVLEAYSHAVAERYRFFSYGDCMLVV
ncbi:MAG TPA: tRNA preQ1(34) S-adenosylmethionine ribosyltransferase-isomerase QueA [Bryobacteraceae bacterium]|nr:tRNA preQ1(34) S-adenosylmethionine ribosyltransferase-isomerase QueA [Bryobacteraceae bacterium]